MQPEPSAAPVAASAGVRVLLVEDHALNREVARAMLDLHGVEVDEAVDGGQAVAMLRAAPAGRWQAVLMDMQMPVLDGLEATRAIRELQKHRELPIIAMTANAMAEDRDRCLAAGMNDHLAKPIIEEELQRVLDRWVGAPASAPRGHQQVPGETATQPLTAPRAASVGDATAALAADEALARLERAVAHDMRAGLGVVSGFGKLLAGRLTPGADERVAQQFTWMQESAQALVKLVDDWGAVSHLLRRPMTITPVDMAALARRAAEQARAADVRFRFEKGLPPVQADAALAERVWLELLANAVKFVRSGEMPEVEAWGRMEGGVPVFGVSDRGVGIPAAHANQLFLPMRRLHGEAYPGAGLGLFVASRLVARHGGRMWLAPSAPEGGTTVCFSLSAVPGGG